MAHSKLISRSRPRSPNPHRCLVPQSWGDELCTNNCLIRVRMWPKPLHQRMGGFPNSECAFGFSPLSHLSLHGFRRSSQARDRKTFRQVHSRRIVESRIDGIGSGAIDRHKSGGASYKPPSRTNVYVNPNYKPPSHSAQVPPRPAPYHRPAPIKNTGEKRDVVLNGVAFQSSARSLVRKDREYTLGKCGFLVLLTYPLSTSTPNPDLWNQQLQARS